MPFGLKNAPSEFQNIMNDIFMNYTNFILSYIDDILIFFSTLDEYFKHLSIFKYLIIKKWSDNINPQNETIPIRNKILGHNIDQKREKGE